MTQDEYALLIYVYVIFEYIRLNNLNGMCVEDVILEFNLHTLIFLKEIIYTEI